MRRRSLVLLPVVALLVATACGGSDDDADPAGDRAEVDDTTTTVDGAGDDGGPDSEVELLDAGSEPRQVLRLAPPADCHQPVRQTVQLDQRISAEGEVQEATSVFEYDITHDCASVDDGRIEVTITYDDIRVVEDDSGATETTEEMFDSIIGRQGSIVYDDRGRVLEVDIPDIDIPDSELGPGFATAMEQMLQQLESSLDQSAAPLPEEPVGVGARYRVSSEMRLGGLLTRYSTEYVVTEIGADRVVADTVTTVEFPPGPVVLPGVPKSAGAEIVSGELNGTGTTTWDLRAVVPYQEGETEGTTVMRFDARGESLQMEQFQHQVLTVEPR